MFLTLLADRLRRLLPTGDAGTDSSSSSLIMCFMPAARGAGEGGFISVMRSWLVVCCAGAEVGRKWLLPAGTL